MPFFKDTLRHLSSLLNPEPCESNMPSLRILLCLPLVPNTQLSMFSGSSKHSRTDMFAVSLGYAF